MAVPRCCRKRRTAISSVSIVFVLLFSILCFSASASASASRPNSSSSQPESHDKLICHTSNPADCYPEIFIPTDEFQIVHDDQHLPPGLHVRLNINTGLKEAKINVPDEEDARLVDLPVDTSVLLVDQPLQEPPRPIGERPTPLPKYPSQEAVKAPTVEEPLAQPLHTLLDTLGLGSHPTEEALDQLREISHDIYYGVKIAEHTEAFVGLLCMMTNPHVFSYEDDPVLIKQVGQAASTVGAALHNNAAALAAVEKSWDKIYDARCPPKPSVFSGPKGETPAHLGRHLRLMLFTCLLPDNAVMTIPEDSPEDAVMALTSAKAMAMAGLIKSPVIRRAFVDLGGPRHVLELLRLEGDTQSVNRYEDTLRTSKTRLANILLENFFDEEYGATPEMWPTYRRGEYWSHHEAWTCDVDKMPPAEVYAEYERQGKLHDPNGNVDGMLEKLAERHANEQGHWSGEIWAKRSAWLKEHKKPEKNEKKSWSDWWKKDEL